MRAVEGRDFVDMADMPDTLLGNRCLVYNSNFSLGMFIDNTTLVMSLSRNSQFCFSWCSISRWQTDQHCNAEEVMCLGKEVRRENPHKLDLVIEQKGHSNTGLQQGQLGQLGKGDEKPEETDTTKSVWLQESEMGCREGEALRFGAAPWGVGRG